MIRVLFVCLGNICRSPMAEALFQHKVRLAGLEGKIAADSAGTGDWHLGEPPHQGTRQILADNGVDYTHRARQITANDLNSFDYIITMDEANRRNVRRVGSGRATITPLLSYAPSLDTAEVPDPYLTGNFEEVFQMVNTATDGLLAVLRRDHGL